MARLGDKESEASGDAQRRNPLGRYGTVKEIADGTVYCSVMQAVSLMAKYWLLTVATGGIREEWLEQKDTRTIY
ncbi:hypothetical protein EYC84_006817 [Monilinia fructicola]|uniref:Uncharacterized protein n=1 Tax=Monilinia fructicola TaxID=38448 RepID=A0A5M9K8E2_MONFR|nr:hypothetical protein EYC84_006817 [Monilinia fructicola]